jgi:hypothetical protein
MHKILISLSWCAGLLLLWLLIPPTALAKIPERVSLQKRAVVTVYVEDRNGRRLLTEEGFFVHEDGVVAAGCRAVQKWLAAADNKLVVDMDGTLQFPMGEMVSSRCVKGHVLFKVPAQGVPTVVLASGYRPKKGERVYVFGPPTGSNPAPIEAAVKTAGDGQFTLALPQALKSAGSPVFSEKGAVIGIVVPVLREDKNTAVVTSAGSIQGEIDRYRRILKRLASLPPEPSDVPVTVFPRVREDATSPERRAALERALERVRNEQNDPEALIALGMAYEDLRMYAEALDAYEQALSINPRLTDAHLRKGMALYRLGRYRQATEAYGQAIVSSPDCPLCYNKLGSALIILGEYGRAVETFREELRRDPLSGEVHFNIGLAHFLNGDYLSAIEEYTILKDLDAKRAESLVELLY